MNQVKRATGRTVTAGIVALVLQAAAGAASAQHVTPAMATALMGTGSANATRCEDGAGQASARLDVLNASLERARLTGNETEIRAALDALQKGFAEVKGRLDGCRTGTPVSAPTAPRTAAAPSPAASAVAGIDHSAMNMSPAGAAAAPTTIRQIGGPAEAALQAFRDALEIGNRDLALERLAPEATITEAGVADGSRDAYAKEHMGVDMDFLKTARVVLLDRQVHGSGDAAHIVSTSRVTGRAGEIPVDVTVAEEALLKATPSGWRITSLRWTLEPAEPARR